MPRYKLINIQDQHIGESLESDTIFEANAEALEKLGWRVVEEEENDDGPDYEDDDNDNDEGCPDYREWPLGYD